MDIIKKYFIQSMIANVDQLVDDNDRLNVDDIHICNEINDNENETIQTYNKNSHETKIIENSNKSFIRKIQSLEEENDRLLSIIENKNITIKNESKCSCNNVSDLATKTISQLTEKVQHLMLELQTIKSSASVYSDSTVEIKQLTDKLNLTNKKICNYRNQIMQLKNDLQVSQNALSNEIGDPALMQTVLSDTGSSNFRGRAQQILMLQQRVNELEGKSKTLRNKDVNYSTVTIRKIEKERKANIDQALKTAQSKVGELTKSLEFWKSRSKALDVEITVLRVQMQKILSKSKNETQLIDKLKAESSNNYNNNTIEQFNTKDCIIKLEESVKLLQTKIEKAEKVIEQQVFNLHERDMKIEQLETEILNQKETIPNHNICTVDFLDPQDIFIKKLNSLENQHLKDLLCIAHNQICEQVEIVYDYKNKYFLEKQKFQKIETKMKLMTSSKPRLNSASYYLKCELNPNEELIELRNKLELAEEERAALKERLNTLKMINKQNVQMFAKTLNDLKQKFIN